MDNPILEQTDLRFRNDDNDEVNATWRQLINVDDTQDVDIVYRIRIVIKETAGFAADNSTFQLQYNHEGGGWNNANAASNVVDAGVISLLVDNADTTQQLSSPDTYVSPNGGQEETTGSAGGPTCDFVGNDTVEIEIAYSIKSGDVTPGDNIDLRVSKTGLVYTRASIRVTVASAGPADELQDTHKVKVYREPHQRHPQKQEARVWAPPAPTPPPPPTVRIQQHRVVAQPAQRKEHQRSIRFAPPPPLNKPNVYPVNVVAQPRLQREHQRIIIWRTPAPENKQLVFRITKHEPTVRTQDRQRPRPIIWRTPAPENKQNIYPINVVQPSPRARQLQKTIRFYVPASTAGPPPEVRVFHHRVTRPAPTPELQRKAIQWKPPQPLAKQLIFPINFVAQPNFLPRVKQESRRFAPPKPLHKENIYPVKTIEQPAQRIEHQRFIRFAPPRPLHRENVYPVQFVPQPSLRPRVRQQAFTFAPPAPPPPPPSIPIARPIVIVHRPEFSKKHLVQQKTIHIIVPQAYVSPPSIERVRPIQVMRIPNLPPRYLPMAFRWSGVPVDAPPPDPVAGPPPKTFHIMVVR